MAKTSTPAGRPVADQVDPPVAAEAAPVTAADAEALSVEGLILPSDEEVLVKTSGAFMLMDPHTGKHFEQHEFTATLNTPFVAAHRTNGQLVTE